MSRGTILVVGTGLSMAIGTALARETHYIDESPRMVIRHREEVPMKIKPLYFERKRHPKKDYSLKSVSKGRK